MRLTPSPHPTTCGGHRARPCVAADAYQACVWQAHGDGHMGRHARQWPHGRACGQACEAGTWASRQACPHLQARLSWQTLRAGSGLGSVDRDPEGSGRRTLHT